MTFEMEVPTVMRPAELDRRLAQGWFRSGAAFFRAPLLYVDDNLRELVHLRIRLDLDPPSRRRKRVLRKGRSMFRIEFGPAVVDADRQTLYEATRPRFVGFLASRLQDVALADPSEAFDTRELRVYHGDRLIALSYFDVGSRAIASILGCHHPDYARYSPGLYTMLEEMDWARAQGAKYYYPGYVVPDLSGFEYKLRLGAIQYRSEAGRWRERQSPPMTTPGADYANARKAALLAALQGADIDVVPRIYAMCWLGRLPESELPYLGGMWHAQVHEEEDGFTEFYDEEPWDTDRGILVAEYLIDQDVYVVGRAQCLTTIDPLQVFEPHPELEAMYETRLMYYQQVLMRTADPAIVVEVIRGVL